MKLDKRTVVEEHFPPAQQDTFVNREIVFAVPAGKHTLSIYNPGADWFTLDSITLTPYALPNKVVACSDGQGAMWYLWRKQPIEARITLKLPGIRQGKYRVVWWDIL